MFDEDEVAIRPWWKNETLEKLLYSREHTLISALNDIADMSLTSCINSNEHRGFVKRSYVEVFVNAKTLYESIMVFADKNNGKLLCLSEIGSIDVIDQQSTGNLQQTATFIAFPTGYISFAINKRYITNDSTDHSISFTFCSTSEKLSADIVTFLASLAIPEPIEPEHENVGYAYMMSKNNNGNGYHLITIGAAGVDFDASNYSESVASDFSFIKRELNKVDTEEPCGRLVILDGPPGTGKTYLVRSLMKSVDGTKFVIVPSHLIEGLADPQTIEMLADESIGSSITLILEDADACLTKRQSKSMNALSSLLNLTSGIIGSCLNLRIVATTNSPMSDFDTAAMRKKRLLRRVAVGSLNEKEARIFWLKHAPAGIEFPNSLLGEHTLADLYSAIDEISEMQIAMAQLSSLSKTQ